MSVPTNPFPGMNPYFQQFWSDVHGRLVTYIGDALSGELPNDLTTRTEKRVLVAAEGKAVAYRADVAVIEPWQHGFPPVWQPEGGEGHVTTVAEPLIFDEPSSHRWVEIRGIGGRLISVVEVLSPANKREDGVLAYRLKQLDLLTAGVNLVEIDLIRGGKHVTAIDAELLTFPDSARHHICVARFAFPDSSRREVYHCPLREALPTIRVPLRGSDPDAPLALQPLIDRCYQAGRYWLIDHAAALDPALGAEDSAWVDERLRAVGLR